MGCVGGAGVESVGGVESDGGVESVGGVRGIESIRGVVGVATDVARGVDSSLVVLNAATGTMIGDGALNADLAD